MYATQDDVKSRLKQSQLWHFTNRTYQCTREGGRHKIVVNNIVKEEFNINHRVTIRPCPISLKNSNLKDCTALHFVYHDMYDIDTFNILLERGADFTVKNGKGDTVLHAAVIRLKNIEHTPNQAMPFINSILSAHVKYQNLVNPQNSDGISHLHAACIANHVDSLNLFLDSDATSINQATNSHCELYPAFTPIHFAVHFNSFEVAQILVNRGADVNVKNASSLTPLDECLKHRLYLLRWMNWWVKNLNNKEKEDYQYKICENEKLLKLLLATECDSAVGFSRLHVASTLKDMSIAEKILNQEDVDVNYAVPIESLIYPGNTAAHFAALNSINAVKMLLRLGAKLETESANGNSVLNVCVRNYSIQEVHDILAPDENWKNVRLSDGKTTLLDFLRATTLAASSRVATIAEMLLQHGADLHATDNKDMTPIHCLMNRYRSKEVDHQVANVLFRFLLDDPKDYVSSATGLSYLHVACFFGNVQAAQKLLELAGSNVEAVISSGNKTSSPEIWFPEMHLLGTPLHVTRANPKPEMIDLLIGRGADVFAKCPTDKYTQTWDIKYHIPLDHKNIMRRFMTILWDRADMQKSWEEKLGLTRLHIACYLKNEESVRSVLKSGEFDINAQTHKDSEIFAGCTPLHLLLTINRKYTYILGKISDNRQDVNFFVANSTVQLLLDHGADVTIVDAKNNTPVHRLYKYQRYFHDFQQCADLLLNAHRDFSVNPPGEDGISHFHLACHLHRDDVVEKFLQQGSVDVNRPIDFFANMNAGAIPLHLALMVKEWTPEWTSISRIVDLLLKHGADVGARDVYGNTPLHESAPMRSPELSIFNKLVSNGADANAENVRGQNPFDRYSFNAENNPNDCVDLLKKYNYRLNSWNRMTGEGYVGKMLISRRKNITASPEFVGLLKSPDVKAADQMGRTVIHNSVAISLPFETYENFNSAIGKFVALGIDLEHQDKSGQTALHYAARFENGLGAAALLKHGADVNIVDIRGMSAFSYVEWKNDRIPFMVHESVSMVLHVHVQKLLQLRIEVSQLNHNLSKSTQEILDRENSTLRLRNVDSCLDKSFFNQVEMSKNVSVGAASLVLFDFLNDTNGLTLYPYLSVSEQTIIDNFFEKLDEKEFYKLIGIIKLQYRKIKARMELIDEALTALRTLLGFSFAGLCEEIIRYLLNSDLKNMIASIN